MGKYWDHCVPNVRYWKKVKRVLKPGAHLVVFGGSKTYHRLACAIEDAGFEIRDSLMWVYGTGFPKSHDVSKGIDKAITAPATGAAPQWEGWGTALKPAFEPIILARKPLSEKTVAANVLRWGTGVLNIGACRVLSDTPVQKAAGRVGFVAGRDDKYAEGTGREYGTEGRWPANVMHDGSDEVIGAFPVTTSKGHDPRKSKGSPFGGTNDSERTERNWNDESTSAARFFYSAKASKADRNGSKHPTVKPVSLKRWLVRLVTPPNGIVLDPFAGSGTTAAACESEGFRCILIERDPGYISDLRLRFPIKKKGWRASERMRLFI